LFWVSMCNKISSMTIYYDFLTWINEILTIQQQEHFRHYWFEPYLILNHINDSI
jgi:hypothetical protein